METKSREQKLGTTGANYRKKMVPQVGFEPTTRCLEGSRSIP